jgi:hypothetical protein
MGVGERARSRGRGRLDEMGDEATTTEAAASADASQTEAARRCHERAEDEYMKTANEPRMNAATLLAVAPTVMVADRTFGDYFT